MLDRLIITPPELTVWMAWAKLNTLGSAILVMTCLIRPADGLD
jgi:hypothetical protein